MGLFENEVAVQQLIRRLRANGRMFDFQKMTTPGSFRADATMRTQHKVAKLIARMSEPQLGAILEWAYDLVSFRRMLWQLLLLEGWQRIDQKLDKLRREMHVEAKL